MLALFLWFLITPQPGTAGIELNISDPQAVNEGLIRQCIAYTGHCNIWYTPGRWRVTKTIQIPYGVRNVYLKDVVIVPCGRLAAIFNVQGQLILPPGEFLPNFHDMTVDATHPCGDFTPPLLRDILWP